MFNTYNVLIITIITLFQKIKNQNFPLDIFNTPNNPILIQLPNNCKKTSSKNPFECIECEENFSLLNGKCPCYDRNCFKCSSSLYGACEKCNLNFELDEKTKSCICEIKHCLFCSENKCDQCETGYTLINGECNESNWKCYDKSCEICTNQNKGGCKKCYDGFNLENGNCIMNPFLNIVVNNNFLCDKNHFSIGYGCNKKCLGQNCPNGKCENICLECKDNILKEILNCRPLNYCNDSHCVMCRSREEGFCDRCEIGYRLQEGKCEKCKNKYCLNCDYTDDGSCNSCMFNYTLINGTCYSNQLIKKLFNDKEKEVTENIENEENEENENKENEENENKENENMESEENENKENEENENKENENKENENKENEENENKENENKENEENENKENEENENKENENKEKENIENEKIENEENEKNENQKNENEKRGGQMNEIQYDDNNENEENENKEKENKENENILNEENENKENENKENKENEENENKENENKENEENENKENEENENKENENKENEENENKENEENENKENEEQNINPNENEEQKESENIEEETKEEEEEERPCLYGIKIKEDIYCTQCNENYTLIDGKCYKCNVTNCQICTYPNEKNISKCLQCKENYRLINDFTCQKSNNKIRHCITADYSKCMKCENNYNLINQKCIFDPKITDCLSYECMSCFNEQKRSQICEDGRQYSEKIKKCNDCNDQNCRICFDRIGCIVCNEGLTLIEGKCLNSTYFANTIDGCALYDSKGNCLTCEEKCTLQDNECYCQSVTVTIIIILFCVIVVILIIFFVVFLRKKNQIREFHERQEANFKREGIELQLLENAKLKDDIIDDILQKDSQLRKCSKCKNELAIIQLDCGCLLCKEDSKNLNFPSLKERCTINNNSDNLESYDIEKIGIPEKKFGENDLINENKKKSTVINTSSKQYLSFDLNNKNKSPTCPVCYKQFNSSQQIAFQCEICFDITSKLFNFNCGCALAVCKTCFNKIIKTKKCPGCRKDIISH